MAKLDVAAAIAVLLVSTSASLGLAASASFDLDVQTAPARFGYNPDLGTMVQEPLTEDLDVFADNADDILGDVEKGALWCLEMLSQDGAGEKCIRDVSELLVFEDVMSQALSFPCCRNVLAIDMKRRRCWDVLYGGQIEIPGDVPGLVASCVEAVLSALAPAPGQWA